MDSIISSLFQLIRYAIDIYTIMIIIRAIMSWVRPNPYHPLVRALYRLTESVLSPVRRMLMGFTGNIGIDFSPFIVFIVLRIFRRIL